MLALDDLIGRAAAPDGLSDPAPPTSPADVAIDELAPYGNDPRGVRSDQGHVGELHRGGGLAEALAHQRDLAPADCNEHGPAGLYPVANVRNCGGEKTILAVVEDRLVIEGVHRFP